MNLAIQTTLTRAAWDLTLLGSGRPHAADTRPKDERIARAGKSLPQLTPGGKARREREQALDALLTTLPPLPIDDNARARMAHEFYFLNGPMRTIWDDDSIDGRDARELARNGYLHPRLNDAQATGAALLLTAAACLDAADHSSPIDVKAAETALLKLGAEQGRLIAPINDAQPDLGTTPASPIAEMITDARTRARREQIDALHARESAVQQIACELDERPKALWDALRDCTNALTRAAWEDRRSRGLFAPSNLTAFGLTFDDAIATAERCAAAAERELAALLATPATTPNAEQRTCADAALNDATLDTLRCRACRTFANVTDDGRCAFCREHDIPTAGNWPTPQAQTPLTGDSIDADWIRRCREQADAQPRRRKRL